jgi:hypothetical protein
VNRRQARIIAYTIAGEVLPFALNGHATLQSIDATENRKVEQALQELADNLGMRAARMRRMGERKEGTHVSG